MENVEDPQRAPASAPEPARDELLASSAADAPMPTLHDVLTVPTIWRLLGKSATLNLRATSRTARNLHDASRLTMTINMANAKDIFQSRLAVHSAGLDALGAMRHRGHLRPTTVTLRCDSSTTEGLA